MRNVRWDGVYIRHLHDLSTDRRGNLSHQLLPAMFIRSLLPRAALLTQGAVLLTQGAAAARNGTAATTITPKSAATYYAPGVPTDVPVEGNYNDYLRPRVHFSPPRYLMNGESLVATDSGGSTAAFYATGHSSPEDRSQWHAPRPRRHLASLLPVQPRDPRRWKPGMYPPRRCARGGR